MIFYNFNELSICCRPELDTNCKKWRLAADILNDLAMSLELCSPLLPDSYFASVLCLATSMKAIVGVAGGATRAALTQHQVIFYCVLIIMENLQFWPPSIRKQARTGSSTYYLKLFAGPSRKYG